MKSKQADIPSNVNVLSETVTMRFVPQESVSLYEAVDADGDVVALLIAEAVNTPEQFEQRSEAEQSAMQVPLIPLLIRSCIVSSATYSQRINELSQTLNC